MSPDDQPLRRDFEHLSATVEKLTRTLEGLQVMMAATYVRQDVYAANQELHKRTHEEQAGDIEGLKSNNTWLWRSIVVAVLPIVLNAIVLAIVLNATGGRP